MIFLKYTYLHLCVLMITVLPTALGHSVKNNKVDRIEPLYQVQFDSPNRNTFEKRRQSTSNDPVRLSLVAYNTTFHLQLEPNSDLFHPQAVVHHQGSSRPVGNRNFMVYKGHVVDTDSLHGYPARKLGWARILIRHDLKHEQDQPILEGAFRTYGDIYHIRSTSNYNLVKRSEDASVTFREPMVIYRDSDTSTLTKRQGEGPHQCGFDSLVKNHQRSQFGVLNKRYNEGELSSQGCPSVKKINYMGAAADCTYVKHYKTVDNARIQIINNFNMASAVFEETFNVALGLINITVMDPTCDTKIDDKRPWNRACDASYALGDRLSDFSLWRSSMNNDGAGLWHLMTNCPTGVEVGLAWLKQLCNSGKSTQTSDTGKLQYVTGAGVSAVTREEWKVVAHEIGHGFGAIHDCTASDCPCEGGNCNCCQSDQQQCDTSGFLMSSVSNSTAEHFSQCSINTICSTFPSIGTCLSDANNHARSLLKLNVCGNGIREPGEDCDTGGEYSDCCDVNTCKFKPQAVCEDRNDSCCHQCQIRPTTHKCRAATTTCDVEEFCTGDSPTCPPDTYLPDGLACGNDGLQCASGQCTSRDAQCLSRGYVMNVTQSCQSKHDECKLLCDSPHHNEKCLLFSGNFIDGTPCGFGGQCYSGECRNSDKLSSNLEWLDRHKKAVIPVGVVILLMLCISGFLLFWFGCWHCTGYRERRQKEVTPIKNNENTLHDSSLTLTGHEINTKPNESIIESLSSSSSSITAVDKK